MPCSLFNSYHNLSFWSNQTTSKKESWQMPSFQALLYISVLTFKILLIFYQIDVIFLILYIQSKPKTSWEMNEVYMEHTQEIKFIDYQIQMNYQNFNELSNSLKEGQKQLVLCCAWQTTSTKNAPSTEASLISITGSVTHKGGGRRECLHKKGQPDGTI